MNIKEEKKGISLIVLVITIIVIIILAVAVILSIANNNPIENAKEARDIHNQTTLEEAANLEYATLYSNKQTVGTTFDTETIRNNLKNQGFNEEEVKKVEITEKGLYVAKYLPTIPNGFTASQATEEKYINTGLVIYEGDTEINDENVATARETRNQFVWIPVDDINEFKRQSFYSSSLSSSFKEPYEGENADPLEAEEYEVMYESVKKYHGFYIARYETSKNESGKAQSIGNKDPWVNMAWSSSMNNLYSGAVGASRNMYKKNESEIKDKDAISTLVYGVQWDQTVRFIEKNYPGISKENNSSYGNYGNNPKIYTGSNQLYKQNNIYDMCGNVREWTMEAYLPENNRVRRGGYCGKDNNDTISIRTPNGAHANDSYFGFRIALYIK